ncbi:hypothetical protein, partial [Lacticaseibacillus paracasei]|uniref:hypothetical protein n=1 Tax=Lacticaseibacillus paracasei TaxID=1597 RepID=UPI00195AA318
IFAHAITTDAWRNSLDHYQEFVIIVALDLKIEAMETVFYVAVQIGSYAVVALVYLNQQRRRKQMFC